MPTVTANNCEMFYQIDDFTDPWRTDTETVWLQHGVGRSTRFWYHWVPGLAGQYRVIRRDMRGHGQSADPGPDHSWSLDELVTDMRDFMDALGLDQVHYVGESIGGILGVLFATRWPERLKSLTICNSPTTIRPAGTQALSSQDGSVNRTLARDGSKGWGRLLIENRIISGKNPAHTEWVLNEWAKTPDPCLAGYHANPGWRRHRTAAPPGQRADPDPGPGPQSDYAAGRPAVHAHRDSQRPDHGGGRAGPRNLCGRAAAVFAGRAGFSGLAGLTGVGRRAPAVPGRDLIWPAERPARPR